MKFTIHGFNQAAMIELGLDVIDATILRWFVDFYCTKKMKSVLVNEKEYKWVKYQAIIDDLPILDITNREIIARRFNNLEKAFVLEKHIKKDRNGTYTCFRPGQNYIHLIESSDESCTRLKSRVQTDPLDSKVDPPLDSKVDPNNPSINKNNSINIISKDIIADSKESAISGNDKNPPKNKYVEYWNTKENLTHHKPETKTYQEAVKLFNIFRSGKFNSLYEIDENYAKNNNITHDDKIKKWTDNEIFEAIDRYDSMLGGDYGPVYKDKLTRNCSAFLYNPMKKTSLFLTKAGIGKDPKPIKEKPINETVYNIYKNELNIKQINDVEKNELIKNVNFVYKRFLEYNEKVGKYFTPINLKGNMFFKLHIDFLIERYIDTNVFDISKIGNQSCWKKYVIWLKSKHGKSYDLEPTQYYINKIRNEYCEKTNKTNQENTADTEEEERLAKEKWENKKQDRLAGRSVSRFQVSAMEY